MPFTPAHAAAALLFRRSRLVFSALVVGTFAPDFEYFLRLGPRGKFGHTFAGAFLFSLPAALVMLWIFQRWAKYAVVALMPQPLRARLTPYMGYFHFGGPPRFALIVGSVLAGIATHIAWDSFTHPSSWLVQHSPFLNQVVHLPHIHPTQACRVIQHASTLVGLAILTVWCVLWYRRTAPAAQPQRSVSLLVTAMLWIALPIFAVGFGVLRMLAGAALAGPWAHPRMFLGDAIITWMAAIWWEIAAIGYVLQTRRQRTLPTAGASTSLQ